MGQLELEGYPQTELRRAVLFAEPVGQRRHGGERGRFANVESECREGRSAPANSEQDRGRTRLSCRRFFLRPSGLSDGGGTDRHDRPAMTSLSQYQVGNWVKVTQQTPRQQGVIVTSVEGVIVRFRPAENRLMRSPTVRTTKLSGWTGAGAAQERRRTGRVEPGPQHRHRAGLGQPARGLTPPPPAPAPTSPFAPRPHRRPACRSRRGFSPAACRCSWSRCRGVRLGGRHVACFPCGSANRSCGARGLEHPLVRAPASKRGRS